MWAQRTLKAGLVVVLVVVCFYTFRELSLGLWPASRESKKAREDEQIPLSELADTLPRPKVPDLSTVPPAPPVKMVSAFDRNTDFEVKNDTFVFASLYTSTSVQGDDYFSALRLLIYRLLRHPDTKSQKGYGFIVMTTSELSKEKRQRLEQDGAKVVFVPDMTFGNDKAHERWQSMFSKLAIWNMTDYEGIALLDSDIFITGCYDSVFDEMKAVHAPPDGVDTRLIPAEFYPYTFAAVPESGIRTDYPPTPVTKLLNAGLLLIKPSVVWYEYLLHLTKYRSMLAEDSTQEQGFLRRVFSQSGPFPWQVLDWKYNTNYPLDVDLDKGSIALHHKFWWPKNKDSWPGVDLLFDKYAQALKEMEKYYAEGHG